MKIRTAVIAVTASLALAGNATAATATPDATFTASSTPTVGVPVTFTAPPQAGVAYQWTLSWTNPTLHTHPTIGRGVGETFTYTPTPVDVGRVDTLLLVVSTGRVGPRTQSQTSFTAVP